MHKENIDQLLGKAIEAENLGDFDQAIKLFVQINDKQPTLALAWFYRGKAHCALREFRNALMCFNKAQQLEYDTNAVMMYRSIVRNNINNFEPPNLDPSHLKEKVPLNFFNIPELIDEKLWTESGAGIQMMGQYEEAYIFYQEALKRNPDYSLAKKNQKIIQKLAQK